MTSRSIFDHPLIALFLGLICSSLGFRVVTYGLADNGGGKSNSTFQTLAEGTQDLAALVGLFATDSVERYSVDYSRGRCLHPVPIRTSVE